MATLAQFVETTHVKITRHLELGQPWTVVTLDEYLQMTDEDLKGTLTQGLGRVEAQVALAELARRLT